MNSKILVIGDVHGHTGWKSLIEKENPDKVIFLGDYVDTFNRNNTPEMQIKNLEDILDYKEEHNNSCIILLGNHDYHYITSLPEYYSGFNAKTAGLFAHIKERFLKNVKLIHIDDELRTIFSHAGVSDYWLTKVAETDLEHCNTIDITSETVAFQAKTGYSSYGDTICNGPLWIRPRSLLLDAVKGYNQVVGHTIMRKIDIKDLEDGHKIYFCDTLPNEYLIIKDGCFQVHTLK